jgi:two-component system, NtrC family, sensor kinase
MPKLIHHSGLADEQAFSLGAGSAVIGRTSECDVCVLHKSLSRRHARIDFEGGRAFLVDLNSKNGTFANGIRIERIEIRPGDVIRLGDLSLAYAGDEPTPRPEAKLPVLWDDADDSDVPSPTLVVRVARVSMEDLLGGVTAPVGPGALKVKLSDAGQRAQDKLQVLLRISQLLSSPDEPDAMLRKILELVFQTLDVDRGAVLLVDPESNKLVPRVTKSLRGPAMGPIYSEQIVEYVRAQGVAALFSDAAVDPRVDTSKSIVFQSIRASMCVPLRPKDEVIGVLYVDNLSVPNHFSEEDLEFLAAFANQAAVAIENAALYRRIEEEAVGRVQVIMQEKLASLGAVVAGIAHEIRNPLNFINNFAELSSGLADDLGETFAELRKGPTPEALADLEATIEDLKQNAIKINEHGRRANSIIQSMLLHARGTSGAREPADLNAVVADGVSLGYEAARTKDPAFTLKLDVDYDPAAGSVDMVSADLGRVFVNVVDNACYAVRQKQQKNGDGYTPALSVRTRARGDKVEVTFRDNGTGVPKEIAEKIFHPFFSTKPSGEGTGLGLSLSHDIVVQGHQGEMRMDSVVGEFTEIVIVVPKRAPQPTTKRLSVPATERRRG